MPAPDLVTFDIFGTVLDWRTGLQTSCRQAGHTLAEGDFDRIIDAQAILQQQEFRIYYEIMRQSLIDTIAMPKPLAEAIAQQIAEWPLYSDAPAIRRVMQIAPCAALTNSDRSHAGAIQQQLGFHLTGWLCSEDTRLYKPNPDFWHQMGRRRNVRFGSHWWHVSAYADYDLAVANELGLTTVFVQRPHAREGAADLTIADLNDLAALIENCSGT